MVAELVPQMILIQCGGVTAAVGMREPIMDRGDSLLVVHYLVRVAVFLVGRRAFVSATFDLYVTQVDFFFAPTMVPNHHHDLAIAFKKMILAA